jgi:hypothetical protein
MLKQFPPPRDYSSLSVSDLLDARDAYHLHLSHLSNVVATAIGRYRIHEKDWYAGHPPSEPRPDGESRIKTEKTLYNSVIKPWSWPSVLVFVSEWTEKSQFADSPDQMVPRALFLPDGRVVPTCVLRVKQQSGPAASADAPSFPRSLIGGGFSLVSTEQKRDHLGSVGCLVTDGHLVYALTNRHVAGEAGRVISAVMRGRSERIGVSTGKVLGKKPFSAVYPGWPGSNAFSNLDIGLIVVDDLGRWTTQIAGLGTIGMPIDLTTDNITLDLLNCPVRAFGGASGPLSGTIGALFYRYKSMAGADYIADLLIVPNDNSVTRPGDSGTLWCLVDKDSVTKKENLRPLAVQWGGHVLVDDSGGRNVAHTFALATIVSTVCRELDIDIVRDWNVGLPEYWGDVGHYTIGAKACQLLKSNPSLSDLMMANIDRVAYRDEQIQPKTFKGLSKADFVPLADVPDKVWKMHGDGARGGSENPNHFADMDKPQPDGRTLLDITSDGHGGTNAAKVDVATFDSYYTQVKDPSRGLLPFRVQQLYQLMVKAAADGRAIDFVAAAGVMAHYVGDACQPLHISYKFNGDPDHKEEDEDGKKVKRGSGVHEAYESEMLNRHGPELLSRLNTKLKIAPGQLGYHGRRDFATDGHDAAVKVVDLMRAAFATITPDEIVDLFVSQPDQLWERFGDKTVDLIADGARCLAMLWESAWKQGGGKITDLGSVDEDSLKQLYLDTSWAPSLKLSDIGSVLGGSRSGARVATTQNQRSRQKSATGTRSRKAPPARKTRSSG